MISGSSMLHMKIPLTMVFFLPMTSHRHASMRQDGRSAAVEIANDTYMFSPKLPACNAIE